MVHDLGRVLGHDHDDDPMSVMYRGHSRSVQEAVCAAAFPPAPVAPPVAEPTPPVDVQLPSDDDTLESDFVPYAPLPRLVSAEPHGPHGIMLTPNNPNAVGRAVVTFYRRGFIVGCGGGVCKPWDLGGRISRSSASLLATDTPTVRAPRHWTIATIQIQEPGTRHGIVVAFTPDRVKPATTAPDARCEFTFCG
jgi:hypothetical protein